MPMHKGLLPREGFKADIIARILGNTALNPFFTLPILLLANFTKKGENLSILHHKAFSRIKLLFYLGLIRCLSSWFSRGVLNNWKSDRYEWQTREIVLVTGGSGGIGEHVAKLLSEMGIRVVVLDTKPLSFEAPSNVHYFECDVTSKQQIAAVAEDIRSKIGHPTVLINNAGVFPGKSIIEATEEDIRLTFNVNALAHFWMAKEFLPRMIENNHGMIVTVASISSWATVPNMVDYSASKHAALAFHEGLAAELTTRHAADKVRTVIVNQGFTRTPLFEGYKNELPFLFPTLEPETVAEAIVRQVLTGKSGQVIAPSLASVLPALAAMPHWLQHGVRKSSAKMMTKCQGPQVVSDLGTSYDGGEEGEEKEEKEVEESTVLVAAESK